MEMTGLRVLHASMRLAGVDLQQFLFKTGIAEFDCLFSVRDDPYRLTLTSRGKNPKFFSFEILRGYRLNAYLDQETYKMLVEILSGDRRSGSPLKPSEFFTSLNHAVPKVAKLDAVPSPVEIVRLRHDVEDRDRPYFDRWEQRGKGPSDRNKAKTRLMLGDQALAFSIKHNKSSIWSAKPIKRE